MLNLARNVILVYGILMIAGGILGYVLGKSKISLIAGVASGLIAIAAYFIAKTEPTPGLAIALVVAVGTGLSMAPRMKTAKKKQSVYAVLVLSAVVAVLAGLALAGL